jgi:uncharacterized protein (DUF1778 family)
MVTATGRLEFRIAQASKSRIERAAHLTGEHPTAFARAAAEERAERVLREHEATTVVPPEYFDQLIAALDAPPVSNATLTGAFDRLRELRAVDA